MTVIHSVINNKRNKVPRACAQAVKLQPVIIFIDEIGKYATEYTFPR